MWAWVALCCVVGMSAVAGAEVDCEVTFDGNTYRRETVLNNIDLARGLAVDFTNNTLYFSHLVNGSRQPAKFDFRTESYSNIEELTGWCRFAVDQKRGEVHAGCGDGRTNGLYQYDGNVGRFVLAGEEGRGVMFVHYYNDTLYYSTYESLLLHTLCEGRSERVHDAQGEIEDLVVDRHGDWIYYNWTGVYRQRAGSGGAGAVRYEGVDNPYELAVDSIDAAYVSDYHTDSIYRLDEHPQRATRVVEDQALGLTVDGDNNIIYYDYYNNRIVRLVKC